MTLFDGSGPRLKPEDFRLLRDLVNRHSGIYFEDGQLFVFERRLRERMRTLGMTDFGQYHAHLKWGPGGSGAGAVHELDEAVDALVTNETYFFREEYQLRAFVRDVLPDLKARAQDQGRKRLILWSAGCSTGEEVYTLAILLLRSRLFEGWDISVFGNDVSRRVLGVARRAVYPAHSFRAMPPEYGEYFVDDPEGKRVHAKVRAICKFAKINLLDRDGASVLGRVDAIFCRNVLIYFDTESRKKVIETFYERLQPGGYLMLGHSESLLSLSTAFELAHLSSDMVYRRPLEAVSVRRSAEAGARHHLAASGTGSTPEDDR